ncbi:MAG: helix-turn-helix domain-containing protein [Acidobacteriota bacterium]
MRDKQLDGELLDVGAAAALLGCSEKSVRARVARHQLPFRRLGSRVFFIRAELVRFFESLPGVRIDEILKGRGEQ